MIAKADFDFSNTTSCKTECGLTACILGKLPDPTPNKYVLIGYVLAFQGMNLCCFWKVDGKCGLSDKFDLVPPAVEMFAAVTSNGSFGPWARTKPLASYELQSKYPAAQVVGFLHADFLAGKLVLPSLRMET